MIKDLQANFVAFLKPAHVPGQRANLQLPLPARVVRRATKERTNATAAASATTTATTASAPARVTSEVSHGAKRPRRTPEISPPGWQPAASAKLGRQVAPGEQFWLKALDGTGKPVAAAACGKARISRPQDPRFSSPSSRQPRKARGAKVGSNGTWHDEMNRRINRISLARQPSFDSITSGTLAKCKSGWGQWDLFCDRRVQADGTMHGPWLPGIDRERDERQIIDYITYEGFFANEGKGWVTSTVRGKVAVVRFMRTCNYYPDPVAGNPRIKASFKALERRIREPTQVKLPATKEVVISEMKLITRSALHSTRDNKTANATIQSAWLFLLRLSEYCFVDGGTHDYCLRLGDIAFYDGEKNKLFFRDSQKAVAMSFVIRGSNTDHARVGCTRSYPATQPHMIGDRCGRSGG